ncbi:MAG: DUF4870 domain-containing protein [Candidatus Nomurabacteria bacterium]|nr:DUF4870 domain-containing protein [Candidatus Nomurabacteria bacterium]
MAEKISFEKKDVEAGKGMAILSYIGILALIPYFAEKKNKYVRFHAVQGINLLLIEVALGIIYGIISAIVTAATVTSVVPYGGYYGYNAVAAASSAGAVLVVGTIFMIVWLALAVFIILGIINAASGKGKEIPLLGKIKFIKK